MKKLQDSFKGTPPKTLAEKFEDLNKAGDNFTKAVKEAVTDTFKRKSPEQILKEHGLRPIPQMVDAMEAYATQEINSQVLGIGVGWIKRLWRRLFGNPLNQKKTK